MDGFRIVKRSDLPSRARFNGTAPGPPHARYQKTKNGSTLNFSKTACEVFGLRKLAIVEYDEEARTLRFTAVDKAPGGLEEEDLFALVWHMHNGSPLNCSIASKRLLSFLGFEFQEALDFPVVSINADRRSIVVTVPAPELQQLTAPSAPSPADSQQIPPAA